jgi:hypothetical protein
MVPTKAVPTDAMVRVDKAGTPAIAIPVITSLAQSIAAGLSIAGQDSPDRQDRRDGGKQSVSAHTIPPQSQCSNANYNSSGAARDTCARSTLSCRASVKVRSGYVRALSGDDQRVAMFDVAWLSRRCRLSLSLAGERGSMGSAFFIKTAL